MNALPSSATIDEKITALNALVGNLGDEFDQAADEAVAGVKGAGKKAAEINQRLERLAVDRRILDRARAKASAKEAAIAAAKEEVERQRHRAAAADHANELIKLAAAIDAKTAELEALVTDLIHAESAVHSELRLARLLPEVISTWQRDIAGIAVRNLTLKLSGPPYVRPTIRDLAYYARSAWGFLMGDDNGR